ncbi:MAG TPA: glycosyltransferase 87 family protein [Anaerolineales bacterium]|nr:glycosyltransferase 87 family protein [Anaerolineales bacterium]
MRRSPITLILLIILAFVALGGVIRISYQIASNHIGGGRFWVEWIGVRAKVEDGISPYSPAVTSRIQDRVDNLFSWAPAPALAYTSPFSSAIVSLPFALIPNPALAHAAWLALQFGVVLWTILSGIRLAAWKPAWWLFTLLILFVLLSLRNMMNLYEGSMLIWVSGFVTAVLLSIRSKRYELAGIFLALTMIQPQAVILWVVFVLLWAGSHRKWSLLVWFVSTLIFLVIVSTLLVPDWLLQYLRIIWNFADYFAPGTPGFAFHHWWPGLGRQLGWALTAILSLVLVIEWRLAFRRDFSWFLWTACLTIAISVWIGIPVNPDAHMLLNLPLVFVFAVFSQRWPRVGKWVALVAVCIVLLWEWGLVWSALRDLEPARTLGLMFPVPLLLLLGLIWVRWWTIKPKRLLIDELRASETTY